MDCCTRRRLRTGRRPAPTKPSTGPWCRWPPSAARRSAKPPNSCPPPGRGASTPEPAPPRGPSPWPPAIGRAPAPPSSAGPWVLDLGAGAAPRTPGLAAADPEITVTAIDLGHVLPVTRQAVAAAGRQSQFQFIEDDMFRVCLEDDSFDLVILGNVCHLFDDAANRRLLERVAGWLAPGGTVAIIDFLPNER